MASRPPDLLFIILDTLRRDRLSAYGHARETSPAFDAFAADGARFTRAVSPAQWTVPAHGSLFTGVYPAEHGLTQANSRLPGSLPTLAELLRQGGYRTAAFCNNPLVGVLNNGLQRGFDEFYNYASAIPQRPFDHRKPWLRRELSKRLRPTARRIANQFALSDELFRYAVTPWFTPLWSNFVNFKGNTHHTIHDLIGYWDEIHAGGADRPLFAYVNLMGAHLPYTPTAEAVARVAPHLARDKAAAAYLRRFNTDAAAWATPPAEPLTDWQRAALLDFYDAEIAAQDAELGRLLAHLRATGALDRTTVIIAADHGETHGEHDLFGHGFDVHQELVHVPLAIRGEHFPRGAVLDETISTRRLFHTLLDEAGLRHALPEGDPNGAVAALSLSGVAAGARQHEPVARSEAFAPLNAIHVLEHRRPAVIERLGLRDMRRALYQGDWKLILRGDQPEALYRISDDPAELHDRLAEHPAQAQTLMQAAQMPLGAVEADTVEQDEQVLEHLRMLGYID
jgi:uncharacterized sulfatase